MQVNTAKQPTGTIAPVTAPAEAVSPAIVAQVDTSAKEKRSRQSPFSRKNRNVPTNLITFGTFLDVTRDEAIALEKVSVVTSTPVPVELSNCLRWAVDQYMATSFLAHIAAYDALPAEQQTVKVSKARGTGARSLGAKIAAMTDPNDIRALLEKKRAAALKALAEVDALVTAEPIAEPVGA